MLARLEKGECIDKIFIIFGTYKLHNTKKLLFMTLNGDPALLYTSKTAKMIEVILLTALWQNVNVLLSNISLTFMIFGKSTVLKR